jgi:FkbM family methyltransferase
MSLEKIKGMLSSLRTRFLSRPKYGLNCENLFSFLKEGSVCIDCGANVGIVVEKFLSCGAEVYAFEPHPAAFQTLKSKFDGNQKVHLFPFAVSDCDGKGRLYYYKEADSQETLTGLYSVCASLMPNKTNINVKNFVEIEKRRLSTFILDLNKNVDIMKMDIEGAEAEVIRDLISTGAYKKVKSILVETHELQVPGLYIKLLMLKIEMWYKSIRNFNLNWN